MLMIDMELPPNCYECPINYLEWGACVVGRMNIADSTEVRGKTIVRYRENAYKRADGCPLKEIIRCGKCRYYQGNHDAPGCAPCSLRGLGEVMWDDFCKRGERWDG